jgi:hypothetical protein
MFRKLVEELKMVRESPTYTIVWLYGTQGYGKSHLLAVLACYLAAQDERVVYIPDCREWLRNPIGGIKKAMLFVWADEITAQEEIETLRTEAEIEDFTLTCQIFVCFALRFCNDRLNKKNRKALEGMDEDEKSLLKEKLAYADVTDRKSKSSPRHVLGS